MNNNNPRTLRETSKSSFDEIIDRMKERKKVMLLTLDDSGKNSLSIEMSTRGVDEQEVIVSFVGLILQHSDFIINTHFEKCKDLHCHFVQYTRAVTNALKEIEEEHDQAHDH